jgi:hypothetical protein
VPSGVYPELHHRFTRDNCTASSSASWSNKRTLPQSTRECLSRMQTWNDAMTRYATSPVLCAAPGAITRNLSHWPNRMFLLWQLHDPGMRSHSRAFLNPHRLITPACQHNSLLRELHIVRGNKKRNRQAMYSNTLLSSFDRLGLA